MRTFSEQELAVDRTDQVAADLARIFDQSMNIECFPDYSGDNQPFEKWLAQWEQACPCPQPLRDWLGTDNPFPNRQLAGDHYHSRYTSDCGGGSEAVYWYPTGGLVVGLATSANWWLVPGTETVPEIEDYQEPEDEDEDEDA